MEQLFDVVAINISSQTGHFIAKGRTESSAKMDVYSKLDKPEYKNHAYKIIPAGSASRELLIRIQLTNYLNFNSAQPDTSQMGD